MAKLCSISLALFRLLFLVGLMATVSSSLAANKVIAWGAGKVVDASDGYDFGQSIVPAGLTNAVQLAGGRWHSLALKGDGTLQGWGDDDSGEIFFSSATNYVAIACGEVHSLALESDGTVAASAGDDSYGQTEVPNGLSNVVAIACGFYHSVALRSDGTVVAWGTSTNPAIIGTDNVDFGQSLVPQGLSNVVAIAAGGYHTLALKADGTMVEWGDENTSDIPPGLSNVVAIASGAEANIALTANGTVAGWGTDTYGETNIPAGLSNVVAIAAGAWHNLAIQNHGNVVAWGAGTGSNPYVDFGQNVVPGDLSNVVQVAGGFYHSLALEGNNPPVVSAPLEVTGYSTNGFKITVPTRNGRVYQLEYANSLIDPHWSTLPLQFGNGGILALGDPTATNATQRFYRLNRW